MNRVFWRVIGVIAGITLCANIAGATKMSDLEAAVASLKARVDQVEQREEDLKTDIGKQNQNLVMDLKKSQADLRSDISDIHVELSQLEEMVKELSQRMTVLEGKATMTPQQGSTPVTTIASVEESPAAPAAEPGAGKQKTAREAYDLGVELYSDGKYDAARSQFEASLKVNPNSASAEDAQFKIAECNYQARDYKRAIIEYDKFRNKYPRSKKIPAAMLKMGLSFEKLGRKDVATTTYKDLIASFPKSSEAAQAKQQLEKM
jgi:tol-pal system protein YbgF